MNSSLGNLNWYLGRLNVNLLSTSTITTANLQSKKKTNHSMHNDIIINILGTITSLQDLLTDSLVHRWGTTDPEQKVFWNSRGPDGF